MRSSLLLALAPLLVAAPSLAQSYAPGAKPAVDDEPAYVEAPAPSRGGYAPRSNDHTGLLVRLSLGIGGGAVNEDWNGGSTLKSSGGAALYSLAVGGAVSPNLSLGGDLFGFGLNEPNVSYGDYDYGKQKNSSVNVGGIGFNATYYVMPANVYLSGTLGVVRIARSNWSSSGASVTTKDDSSGLGLSLMVGKEWMVSREWGLGVAGQFITASTSKTESGTDVNVGSTAAGVSFTATYF